MLLTKAEKNQTFLDLYEEVFDDDDNVRVCTRRITSKLIAFANKNFCDESASPYGSDYTGVMNVSALRDLHTRVLTEMIEK